MTPKKTPNKPVNQDSDGESYRVLRVNDGYQGRPTRERLIQPGLYLENDARLFGAADLLVQKGHAEWIQGVSPDQIDAMKARAMIPTSQIVPDGFRGMPPAEGQREHGLLTPQQVAAMNKPGYEPPSEPEPDRNELGETLPPAPDGFRGMITNPDGSHALAGQEGDQTEYAPDGQRPIVGSTNPENRTAVPPVVSPDERQRVKKEEGK